MWGEHRRELAGAVRQTTNNRMELTAAIEALGALKRPCKVTLVTDSVYLKNGVTRWLPRWKAQGWRTAGKKPVKNKDLWLRLEELATRHVITWRWVRGHSGTSGNERADALANRAIDDLMSSAP